MATISVMAFLEVFAAARNTPWQRLPPGPGGGGAPAGEMPPARTRSPIHARSVAEPGGTQHRRHVVAAVGLQTLAGDPQFGVRHVAHGGCRFAVSLARRQTAPNGYAQPVPDDFLENLGKWS
jgi:hypothetical protein